MTDHHLDDFLDRQQFADAIEACTDKGVTERPPIEGVKYAAFVVHPSQPGNLFAMAIAHRAGEKFVVDVIRDDISIADACAVLERYGISKVTGDLGEEADALAHAVAGAVYQLQAATS